MLDIEVAMKGVGRWGGFRGDGWIRGEGSRKFKYLQISPS